MHVQHGGYVCVCACVYTHTHTNHPHTITESLKGLCMSYLEDGMYACACVLHLMLYVYVYVCAFNMAVCVCTHTYTCKPPSRYHIIDTLMMKGHRVTAHALRPEY